jgi:hypothetical protein
MTEFLRRLSLGLVRLWAFFFSSSFLDLGSGLRVERHSWSVRSTGGSSWVRQNAISASSAPSIIP